MKKTFFICLFFLTIITVTIGGISLASSHAVDNVNGVSADVNLGTSNWNGATNFTDNFTLDIQYEGVSFDTVSFEIQYRKNYLLCRKLDVRADKEYSGNNLIGVTAYETNGNAENYDIKLANYNYVTHVEVTASYSSVNRQPTAMRGEYYDCNTTYNNDRYGGLHNHLHLFGYDYY